jgi:general nucleoside transport system ATP-binding protein
VMIISTELDEVMELADRIAVIYKGKLVGIVPAGTGRDVLGLMMAGIPPEEHTPVPQPGPASTAAATSSTSDAEGGNHV